MRELKFRAWNKEDKYMRKFESHKSGSSGYDSLDEPTFGSDTDHLYEIMQYTGLNDKNGKEIYEGDYLEFSIEDGDIYLVQFEGGTFGIAEGIKHRSFGIIGTTGAIVIGNIHENPELLEKASNK